MTPAARTAVIEKTLHHLAEARNGVSLLDGPGCVDAQLLDDLYEKWLRESEGENTTAHQRRGAAHGDAAGSALSFPDRK